MDYDADVSVHAAALSYFLRRNIPRVVNNGRRFSCRSIRIRTCDEGSILNHAAPDACASSEATRELQPARRSGSVGDLGFSIERCNWFSLRDMEG
jgi:hypothetical protein